MKFTVTMMWSDKFDGNLFRLVYVVERKGDGKNDPDF